MEQIRFLCLAVSRRESGNCIAGIDIDSGKWLRPIRSKSRAAFADADLIVIDNHTRQPRFMALLDLLSIPLKEHAPTNSQPENWVVAPSFLEQPPVVLRTCHGKRTVEFLLSHAETANELLQSPTDSIAADALTSQPLTRSLALVRPVDLAWRVSPNSKQPGKLQVRAQFRHAGVQYSLVVTDPVWETKCHQRGVGVHAHAELASVNHDLVFLCISLAAIPFHGLHYKLVAGVIEMEGQGVSDSR